MMAPRSIFWRAGAGKAGSGLRALQLLYYNNSPISKTILRFFIKVYRIIVVETENGREKQHPAKIPVRCADGVRILPKNMGKSERSREKHLKTGENHGVKRNQEATNFQYQQKSTSLFVQFMK